jgi:LemA protein
MTLLYIILALIVILILWIIGVFNGLVTLRNRAQEAWADIDVQLKRRYDLIPNLVETVKGYATHEKGVFEQVSLARSAAMGAGTASGPGDASGMSAGAMAAKAAAENQLAGTLKTLFAVAEAYPDLKANQNFLGLQSELTDTEDKIQAARRFYNGNVRDLNTRIQRFPGNVIAGSFHFTAMQFFELGSADEAAKQPVKVSF